MIRIQPRIIFFMALIGLASCEYKDLPLNGSVPSIDCSKSTLAISLASKTDASGCNLIDGVINVSASGGASPYAYSINGGAFQTSAAFKNLAPGVYNLSVSDANLCTRVVQVDLFGNNSTLDATYSTTADSECLTDNGSVIVTPSGGVPPYTYQFGTGSFDNTSFQHTALAAGFYTITIKDANDCPKIVSVIIPRGISGVSYATQIKPIVDKSCAITGCHNGDNGASRNWTVFANFQQNAQNVKIRTGNKSMPLTGSLTDDEIKLIACWVDDGANNN